MENVDKAGEAYWDQVWRQYLPQKLDPNRAGVRNYPIRQTHKFFVSAIPSSAHNIIELGCAASAKLPYLALEFDLDPWGLDYLESGCETERAVLRRDGLQDKVGQIMCGNIFDPPVDLLNKFDIAFSWGLVEHFQDTADVVRSCAAFVKPGGRLVTVIPNMLGLMGWLQQKLDRAVFDKHVPLDLPALREAHIDAGLSEVESQYLLPFSAWVLTLTNRGRVFRNLARLVGGSLTIGLGVLHEHGLPLRPNSVTSPMIACVFEKPLS